LEKDDREREKEKRKTRFCGCQMMKKIPGKHENNKRRDMYDSICCAIQETLCRPCTHEELFRHEKKKKKKNLTDCLRREHNFFPCRCCLCEREMIEATKK
jgi:hypothetical protein